ncbi:preprotein translocase subunit SecY, partial [Tsukamurella conjunctivitidis]
YMILFAALIIFFCFFYTALQFNSKETAENLKRNGGFIPGIRPGIHTSQYLDRVLTRITLWGSLYITIICLLPEFFNGISPVQMYFGGTSILIAVVVVMDLVTQIQALLMSQQYESLMKKANISSALNGTPPNF